MDMVGYSRLLLDEQRQFQEQLTEIVRDTEQVRVAKEAGKLIRLPAWRWFFSIAPKPHCDARSKSVKA